MKPEHFKIGEEFRCGHGTWRVTDVGSRTVVAIRIDLVTSLRMLTHETRAVYMSREEAEKEGMFSGPPYMVAEVVFDEFDMDGCEKC